MMISKRQVILPVSAIITAGLLWFNTTAEADEPQEAATPQPATPQENQVLVTVDGATLTTGEVQEEIGRRMGGANIPEEQLNMIMPRLEAQMIDEFIRRTLLENEARKQGFAADQQDVDTALDDMKKALPPGLSYEEALKQYKLTDEKLRTEIGKQIVVQKLLEKNMQNDEAVTEEEINTFFEQNQQQMQQPETVHARHILLKADEAASAEERAAAKTQAEAVRQQLLDGADFAELATAQSACPSKDNGGDLGTFPRGQMVPAFDQAAFEQKVDEIGAVVETAFGYHIIQVLEHNDAKTAVISEVKDKIRQYLKNQKQAQSFEKYVENLKADAKIEYAKPRE